jgi:hypothetical protein
VKLNKLFGRKNSCCCDFKVEEIPEAEENTDVHEGRDNAASSNAGNTAKKDSKTDRDSGNSE